jgi:hypothetical protein
LLGEQLLHQSLEGDLYLPFGADFQHDLKSIHSYEAMPIGQGRTVRDHQILTRAVRTNGRPAFQAE